MLKKLLVLLLIALLTFTFTSCGIDSTENGDKDSTSSSTSSEMDGNDQTAEVTVGELAPLFDTDWPSEMLPADFPNLGKVTKVYDSRTFVKKITVNWNILTEAKVQEIVDKLNAYLDYDHAWQGGFYSDGIKYKPGTEDEFIKVVIRYAPSASGELEPELKPQFYLEISGVGIPDSE